MTGGSITGNSAKMYGGGVYVSGGYSSEGYPDKPAGVFRVSGNVTITGNSVANDGADPIVSNVFLHYHSSSFKAVITLGDTLDSTSNIGVTLDSHYIGVFTSSTNDAKAKDYTANFASDNTTYSVLADGNELKLGLPPVSYIDHETDGTAKNGSCDSYTVLTDQTAWADGTWYVLKESKAISDRITVTGTVNLILCDGATLTASKGITVASENTLNIYSGSTGENILGTGVLTATGDVECAGIGGSNEHGSTDGGAVNIHGGTVNATGGASNYADIAGIGGGYNNMESSGTGGSVTIYGGTVNATGSGGVSKGIVGTLTLGTGMHLYGATSANPENDLSNHLAGAGEYTGTRYQYMTVNNVAPKPAQTIDADDVTAAYGDTGKSVSASVSGELSYAVKSGSDVIEVDTTSGALTIKKFGTATVTVTAAETNDYAAATKDVTVTVSKATVTVTAKNQSIYVGDTVPTLAGADFYTVTGLVGADTLATEPTLAYQKDSAPATPDNSAAGTYDIVPSGAVASDNYTISYVNGTLTVSTRPSTGPSDTSGPATTTITIPVSGDDETVNVTVQVKGDTATVTGANVETVLEAEDVGTVTIDVSTLKDNVTEVVIPSALLSKINDAVADETNNADGMEIKLPGGTVTFDADALAAITEQADGKDLTLNLDSIGEKNLNAAQREAVADMEVEAVYDAYMTSNGTRISDFQGGKATVSVPYELKENQIPQGITVWYVADDGTRTQMTARYVDGRVEFDVPHFSNYVIVYDAEKAAACPQDETCPISKFTDADPTAWYHDGVHYVVENGMMNGVGNNQFAPNGTTSRGMIATILYRMESEPDAAGKENPFADVEVGKWYTDAVIWAAENKIVDGYGNGKFGPNDPITREQLAAILYRYAKFKEIDVSIGEDTNILSYNDAADVSAWAVSAAQWVVGSGLITGRTTATLNPKDNATRAEIATIMLRYCTQITV